MNLREMLDSIIHSIYTLKDAWPVKLAASFIITTVTSFFASKVGTILLIFFALVMFDLFTRWLALSKKHLDDTNAEHKSLWACFVNIRKARAAGYIQSAPMKHRFAGKFFGYMVLCGLAILLDQNIQVLGDAGGFVKLFVVYMGISEAISILENLQEAGFAQAGDLLDIIKSRRKGLR